MFTSLQQLSNFTAYFHHKRIKDRLEIFGIFRTQPAPSSRVASSPHPHCLKPLWMVPFYSSILKLTYAMQSDWNYFWRKILEHFSKFKYQFLGMIVLSWADTLNPRCTTFLGPSKCHIEKVLLQYMPRKVW